MTRRAVLVQSLAGSCGKSTAGSERCEAQASSWRRASSALRRAGHCSPFGPALSMAGQIQGLSLPTTERVQLVEGMRRSDRVKAAGRAALTPVAAQSRRLRGCTSGTDTKSKPSPITSVSSAGRFGTQVSSFPSTSVRFTDIIFCSKNDEDDYGCTTHSPTTRLLGIGLGRRAPKIFPE